MSNYLKEKYEQTSSLITCKSAKSNKGYINECNGKFSRKPPDSDSSILPLIKNIRPIVFEKTPSTNGTSENFFDSSNSIYDISRQKLKMGKSGRSSESRAGEFIQHWIDPFETVFINKKIFNVRHKKKISDFPTTISDISRISRK